MSIQGSINQALGTGAAAVGFKKNLEIQQQKAQMQRQKLLDQEKRKQANQIQKDQAAAKKQQKADFEALKNAKDEIKNWHTSLGPLKDIPPMVQKEVIKSSPELQQKIKKVMEMNNGTK